MFRETIAVIVVFRIFTFTSVTNRRLSIIPRFEETNRNISGTMSPLTVCSRFV